MTPRKKMGQKAKRSTSQPRVGVGRAGQKAPGIATQPQVVIGAPAVEPGPEPNRDRAHRWSITYPTRQALFKDAPSERRPGTLEEFHPAALEQFEEARQLAMRALDSGAVGEGECMTIISGQGNTDHKPTNGQPNDGLTISIRRVDF